MTHNLKQQGFSIVEALLILVIVGLIGGSGYYVLNAKKNADKSLNNAASQEQNSTIENKTSFDLPKDWQWYENKENRIKFAYPKSYGSVMGGEPVEANNSLGYRYTFSDFNDSDLRYLAVSIAEKNFERRGLGSVCNLAIAPYPNGFMKLTPTNEGWGTARVLVDEPDISAVETVSYDTSDTGTNCFDAEISLLKRIDNNKFSAVGVHYAERTEQVKKLNSQEDYNSLFKVNPSNFISSEVRDTVIKIGRSASAL